MTFIIVDSANTFFRSRHVVRGDADIKLGMALHIMFNSIKKAWQDFNGSHVVFCLEGRSWRKDFYEPYKKNRSDLRAALSPKEQREKAAEAKMTPKEIATKRKEPWVDAQLNVNKDNVRYGFIS